MVHGGAFGHIKGFVRPQMSEEKMPQLMHQCGELNGRVVVAVDQHPVLRDLLLGGSAQYPDRTCFLARSRGRETGRKLRHWRRRWQRPGPTSPGQAIQASPACGGSRSSRRGARRWYSITTAG